MMKKILKRIIKIMCIILMIMIAVSIYITFIERELLVVKKHDITINKEGKDTIKIIQFTDTQLGEYYNLKDLERAINRINKLEADVVVFTGDLIDNASKYDDIHGVARVLLKINANLGKYAIYGNHDYGGEAEKCYENIMNEAGFKALQNGHDYIEVNGEIINFFGGDDALMGKHDAKRTISAIKKDQVNILLIHEPDLIDKYNEYPVDLALSGHSHGGQVYIPFYGPLKKNLLAEKYNRGFYDIDNERKTKLYVNTGLGNTKVPFRFFTIPEISVFNLKI